MVSESDPVGVGAPAGGASSSSKMPTLEEFGTNLTKLAEEVFCEYFTVRFFVSLWRRLRFN